MPVGAFYVLQSTQEILIFLWVQVPLLYAALRLGQG